MPLNLACRVANDLALLAGKPVRALHLDVLVVGHAQDVSAAEGVGGLVTRRSRSGRPADGRVVGGSGADAETPCGADTYQRTDSCE